jgi:cytochrome P450
LRSFAQKNEIFFLDPITLRFGINLIGTTALNASLNVQKGYNTLADGMLNQIRWHNPNAEVNPFSHIDFVRPFIHWKNGRTIDRYIGAELDKRYEEYKTKPNNSKSRSVIDLVIQEYLKSSEKLPAKLDSNFRTFAIRQIRLFIFAGYDSLGSVICYCFHLLSKNPQVCKRSKK